MQTAAKAWLAPFNWEFVTGQNEILCKAKNALHKPTSDGHEVTRETWERHHKSPMSLAEGIDLCRKCHRMAPFCFYNGSTLRRLLAC